MSDLISRQALKSDILSDNVIDSDIKDYLVYMIDGMETAYDIDKIVLQLCNSGICYGNNMNGFILLSKAIQIVKG